MLISKIFFWLYRLVLITVSLSVLALISVYFLASRSLPDYSKDAEFEGLTAPIEIIRDTANVPHIVGEHDKDMFFGLGYAHAQDRLWQMILLRRTVQGRLSEVFGEATLDTDILLRRFDFYRQAQASLAHQTPQARAALEAYAQGVNARLAEINENALGRGAPELFLFPSAISAWHPADSIALLKLMAVQLSGHAQNEVLRAKTLLALDDPQKLRDILPDVPGSPLTDLPDYATLMGLPKTYTLAATSEVPMLWPIPRGDLSGASNGFAASGARSAAGKPILANDPHLGLTAPAIWYLARMDLKSGPVIGGTIPGIPLVLIGRSNTLGWGLTSSYLDDQDLYMEELHPDDPKSYRTPDGFAQFSTRQTIIEIKDSTPVTLDLRWSRNGVVLDPSSYSMEGIIPPNHVPALAWSAFSNSDTSFSAGFSMMQSASVETALEHLNDYVAPSQNITLVDETNIALATIGAFPRRDPNHETQGRLPALGWKQENTWQGVFEPSSNPVTLNPTSGIVGNTNNKVVDRPFPNHMSFKWGDSQRIQRWSRLMKDRKVHTRESFFEAQLDTVSFSARTLLPLIGADLWFTGEAAPNGTPEATRNTALELLANWNGEMNEHLPEPLIYSAWMRALQDRLIRDDIGPLADQFKTVEPLFLERVYRNVDGASQWCDIRQSAKVETCDDIARLALDDALVWIGDTYGTNVEALRWGDAHRAMQNHPVLGDVPVLRYFVNIQQSTSGGDNTLMRGKTSGTLPNPFANVHAAGYRGVYDFADPDSSVFIISTGQSGHFLSRFYDNLGQLWRRGEYVPMSLDLDLARAASVGISRFSPKGAASE